ncbi:MULTISPECIES: hypothetical protein [unclassified Iodidimonas]|jgi:hypothetical protein|nr:MULTISPECIES: hypothetical protein [unclassified Iodidimonas]
MRVFLDVEGCKGQLKRHHGKPRRRLIREHPGPLSNGKRTMATQHKHVTMQYADALATELLRHLGYEAAEKTCCENHWDGVLEALRKQAERKPVAR